MNNPIFEKYVVYIKVIILKDENIEYHREFDNLKDVLRWAY